MKLYYYDTLAPRKVCAAAKYLQSPVDYVFVDFAKGDHKSPSYLALNPNGKVPTLVCDDMILWEADAIICELARRAGSSLWPQDSRQIEVIRWLSWNHQHFTRHGGSLYFEHVIRARFNIGPVDEAAAQEAQTRFRFFAAILDKHLENRSWLVGDAPTVADFSVASTLPYAEKAHLPLKEFPAIHAWHERMNSLEGWSDPYPARESVAA